MPQESLGHSTTELFPCHPFCISMLGMPGSTECFFVFLSHKTFFSCFPAERSHKRGPTPDASTVLVRIGQNARRFGGS